MVLEDYKVLQELLVYRDLQALQVVQEMQVLQVQGDYQDQLVVQDRWVLPAHKEAQVLLVRVLQGLQDQGELLVYRDLQV